MRLPVAVAAGASAIHYMLPRALTVCWREKCFVRVNPECDLGLCPGCIDSLVEPA